MTKTKYVYLILVILISSSCSIIRSNPTRNHPTSNGLTVTPEYESPTVSKTIQPLPTLYKSSSTPELSTTISSTAEATEFLSTSVISRCLNITNYLTQGVSLDGNILIQEDSNDRRILLWNVSKNELISPTIKTDTNSIDFRISMNGQWLAYLAFRKDSVEGETYPWLVIMSADGNEYASIKGNGWKGIVRWLDNNRILIRGGSGNIIPLIVLNPFTKEIQTLQPDFPGILDFPILREWANGTETVYDSTLSRVVYPQNNNLILLDLPDNNILGQINPVVINNAVPIWSPDSQKFVYSNATKFVQQPDNASNFELFMMSRNGEITQLTNLNKYFTDTRIPPLYSWSPNGRYVAFYFVFWKNQKTSSSWAIYDILTNKTTSYCIKPYTNTITTPVWSPNNQQLLIEAENPQSPNNRILISIDVEKNLAINVSEGKLPYGWMILH